MLFGRIETETLIFLFIGGAILLSVLFERGLARWQTPAILAYIIAGVFIGSFISPDNLRSFDIVNTLTLSLMGLHLGTELRFSEIFKMGRAIITITLVQSFVTWVAVFVGVALLSGNIPLGIIYAALAVATAPAGTVEVIKQYKAKGKFTQTLFAVMGLDDIVALLVFSFSLPIAKLLFMKEIGATSGDHAITYSLLHAFKEILLAVGIGGMVGLILCQVSKKIHDKTLILLVAVGVLFMLCGIAEVLDISPLLLSMCVGLMLVNRSRIIARKYSNVYAEWAPPIYLIFFAIIGAKMDIGEFFISGYPYKILVGYMLFRCFGKYFGAFIGAIFGKADKSVRNYLGWTLFSQAGVTLGLTYASVRLIEEMVSHSASINAMKTIENITTSISESGVVTRITSITQVSWSSIYSGYAAQVATIMTTASFLILLFGPILVKWGLKKAGEIKE